MHVKDIMSPRAQTIAPDATVAVAQSLMERENLHHLVITQGKDILGVLSEKDCIRRASGAAPNQTASPTPSAPSTYHPGFTRPRAIPRAPVPVA